MAQNTPEDSAKCPKYKKTMDRSHPVILLVGALLGWGAKAFLGTKKES